jgi:H+-translocating NAD(P) transhydrogenase subunit beta
MILGLNLGYLVSVCLFILGLKLLAKAETAKQGNFLSMLGMLVAVVVTLVCNEISSYSLIGICLFIGGGVGVIAAKKIKMTSIPEMVALLNGFGGLSSFLVAFGSMLLINSVGNFDVLMCFVSIIVGCITFSGSIIAWAKLAGVLPGNPVMFFAQRFILFGLILCAFVTIGAYFFGFGFLNSVYVIALVSTVIGVLLVVAIGGGDMPVVIALLNSYSGIAASLAGIVIGNVLLIVVGILVGASGLILTNIMCKAMNRKLVNVIFGGFSSNVIARNTQDKSKEVSSISSEDTYLVLEAAQRIIVVPGYGLAVSQAQHVVRELSELLSKNNCDIEFAIHPVAGRMPGHMNVLLAEANIDYDQLIELEDANQKMPLVDVAIVIGANDVVNPDAYEDDQSQLYGMPIIDVAKAQTVIVLKRSMNPGFSGVENPLFFKSNTRMLFGDAKSSLSQIVHEFKS